MLTELKFALRSLLKSPGYTTVALVTLALGLGANTAMFGIVNAVLLAPGPYPDAGRLVRIFRTSPISQTWPHSLPNLDDERAQADLFSHWAAYQWWTYSLAEPGQPAEQLAGVMASADLFPTLGLPPLLGRTFTRADQQPGRDRVAVLSYACWQRRFAGDPAIVGRVLRLDGEPVTVIGVMPARFADPLFWGRVEVWRPIALLDDWRQARGTNWLNVLARLKPGVALGQAQAELDTIAARLARAYPANNAGNGLRVVPLQQSALDAVGRRVSWLTLGLAAVVLLIACANLASLQLARAAGRVRESAIRAALGASRARLMARQLAESALLALAGGALGVLVAAWLDSAIGGQLISGDAADIAVRLDWRVLVFAAAVSLATGVAFGVVPAWAAARVDLNAALKQQARGATGDRSQFRLRHGLIVAEVALALVLLSGAGFFVRGLQRILHRDFGWDPSGLLTGTLTLPSTRYPDDAVRGAFYERLGERLAALPGVQHVALGTSVPTRSFASAGAPVMIEGRPTPPPGKEPLVDYANVNADYFAALRIPLVAGRLFPADLRVGDPRVVVINETTARTLWPGQDPIGKRLSFSIGRPRWEQVIGVVRDVGFAANYGPPDTRMQAYRPLVFEPWGYLTIAVRAAAPAALAMPVRRAVAALDPDLPVAWLRPVRTIVDDYQHNLYLANGLLGGFAALGLLLAAIGLFGVISHLVARRLSEFGIRLALGASTPSVLWLALGSGLRLVAAGTLLGLAGALALLRVLGSVLPGIPGQDPFALAAIVLGLVAVAGFACWLPARRATKVDPIIALRSE